MSSGVDGNQTMAGTMHHDIDADQIETNLADGVLTVRVPKRETAKSRRITVNEGS